MPTTRLVAVGAIACDVILGVPFFPPEDSKLRATSFTKRRGGNVGNTLEVLQQLVKPTQRTDIQSDEGGRGTAASATAANVELALVAALPARTSPSITFIASSMNGNCEGTVAAGQVDNQGTAVDMRHCLFREEFDEPVTSYIISSAENSSRTIINHNPLPEMTFGEFAAIADDEISSMTAETGQLWFHFEGRIPDVTLQCMQYLRNRVGSEAKPFAQHPLMISVELEKPGREGLQALAHEADVVFYSRSWAEGEGYSSAQDCLQKQATILRDPVSSRPRPSERSLICTWGSEGACGLRIACGDSESTSGLEDTVIASPALKLESKPVVDTTGAGDTFIAAMLYRLLASRQLAHSSEPDMISSDSRLRECLDFANALAGRKILQYGFADLGP